MRPLRAAVLFPLVPLLMGCASAPPEPVPSPARPAFVDRLIAEFQASPVANPPASITRYTYQGRTVFYVPPRCCDIPGEVYAEDGSKVCEPDGGFSGRGDGKCPDFSATRRDETPIWADDR